LENINFFVVLLRDMFSNIQIFTNVKMTILYMVIFSNDVEFFIYTYIIRHLLHFMNF